MAFAAEPAGPAGGDAGHQNPLADLDRFHPAADRLDGPDSFMAEDPPLGHGRDVSLEDVQIRAAYRGADYSHDRVGVGGAVRLGHFLPGLGTRPVVHEGSHGHLLCLAEYLAPWSPVTTLPWQSRRSGEQRAHVQRCPGTMVPRDPALAP